MLSRVLLRAYCLISITIPFIVRSGILFGFSLKKSSVSELQVPTYITRPRHKSHKIYVVLSTYLQYGYDHFKLL